MHTVGPQVHVVHTGQIPVGERTGVVLPLRGEPFKLAYSAKFAKAAAKITDDLDELLAFYDYPAEHWVHLRTTNPIWVNRPTATRLAA